MDPPESVILDKFKTLGPPSARLVLCKVAIPSPSCGPRGWRLLSRLRSTRLVVIGCVFPDRYLSSSSRCRKAAGGASAFHCLSSAATVLPAGVLPARGCTTTGTGCVTTCACVRATRYERGRGKVFRMHNIHCPHRPACAHDARFARVFSQRGTQKDRWKRSHTDLPARQTGC